MVLAAGIAPALATLSTSCLYYWTTRAAKAGSVKFGLTKPQTEAKVCIQAGMKRITRLFVLVVVNALGLSAGLGGDFAEVESRYMGDGTFQYTLRTLEDPRIAQLGFDQLIPYPFTNYLSNVTPPHWTNIYYQGEWQGIGFDGSVPQPRLNEISFSVSSSSTHFKLQQHGFITILSVTLADCLGGESFGGYRLFDCLVPCSAEEADGSAPQLLSSAQLLPDLVINELIVTDGEVHGLRFTWNEPSTVELQGSHDLAEWTAVARIYGDSPQTTWVTNAPLNSFGDFFRLRLITNSHPSTALASSKFVSQPERSPGCVIVNHISTDGKAVTIGFASVSNMVYEVDHCEAGGRVIETKRVTATSVFTTAVFEMTEPRQAGFFKVRQVTK
jgi:hypothetical protein